MKQIFLIYFFIIISTSSFAKSEIDVIAFPKNENSVKEEGLQQKELYFNPMDDFAYTENWHTMAQFGNGWILYSNVLISNMSISRPSSAIEFSIYSPDGKIFTSKKEYSKKELNADKKSYSIKIGKSFIGGTFPEYKLYIEQDGYVIDLNFKNATPGWKMNSGDIFFGSERERFWKYILTSPRAMVNGRLNIKGDEITVSGIGFQDHSRQNISPHEFSTRWVHLRLFGEKNSIIYTDVKLPEDYNRERIDLLVITDENNILLEGSNVSLSLSNFAHDEKFGYDYPQKIQIHLEEKGNVVDGTVAIKQILEHLDVLHHLNFVLRGLIHTFIVKPAFYRCFNEYNFKLNTNGEIKTVSGRGLNEVVFIKQKE